MRRAALFASLVALVVGGVALCASLLARRPADADDGRVAEPSEAADLLDLDRHAPPAPGPATAPQPDVKTHAPDQLPPAPDWIRALPVQISGYSDSLVFGPRNAQDATRPRKLLGSSQEALRIEAGLLLPKLTNPDPDVRSEACSRIGSLARYASLPDAVQPLSRLAAEDPHGRRFSGKATPKPGDLLGPLHYPVRRQAQDALATVLDRIRFDDSLAGMDEAERREALRRWWQERETHAGPGAPDCFAGFIEVELARDGRATMEWVASLPRPRLTVVDNQEGFVYTVSSARGSGHRAIQVAGMIGGPEAEAYLRSWLDDAQCRVEKRVDLEQMPQVAAPPTPPADASECVLVHPVRNAAAEALARLGRTVRMEGDRFIATG